MLDLDLRKALGLKHSIYYFRCFQKLSLFSAFFIFPGNDLTLKSLKSRNNLTWKSIVRETNSNQRLKFFKKPTNLKQTSFMKRTQVKKSVIKTRKPCEFQYP